MQLICCAAGKILEDSKAISDYKIEEKNFVVVMVTKVRNQIVAMFCQIKFIRVLEEARLLRSC